MSRRNNVWPAYRGHNDARCFSLACGALLDQETVKSSGMPHGFGEFTGKCSRCQMTTWYDIEEPSHDAD